MTRDGLPRGVAEAIGLSPHATWSTAPQGMTSKVSFVDDGGQRAVLKRCRDLRYIDWLRREHEALVALAPSFASMPRAIGYHEVEHDGRVAEAFLLMTRLPGASLWDVVLKCAPIERGRYFRTLGTLLRNLHTAPPPAAFRHQRPWIDRILEKARTNLSWCDGSPELLVQLETTRPANMTDVVIHGDLALDNVLVDADGSMRLIDWSGGDLGDPRYDIALALNTEPEMVLTDTEVSAFFDGYGAEQMDARTMAWFRDLYEFY